VVKVVLFDVVCASRKGPCVPYLLRYSGTVRRQIGVLDSGMVTELLARLVNLANASFSYDVQAKGVEDRPIRDEI